MKQTVSSPEIRRISPAMTFLLGAGCGIVSAGSYFAQPFTGVIGHEIGLSRVAAGLIVTVSQLGYVLGLVFAAPLGDILENRRLLLCTLGGSAASLLLAATAPVGIVFLAACFGIGMFSIAVQMLVTLASFMSGPGQRGHVVGSVTSGLLIGILLAWPLASFAGGHFGWRMLFMADAAVITLLAAALSRLLPSRAPPHRHSFSKLIGSLPGLLRMTPELGQRAIMQACLFGVFSLFWTSAATELRHRYELGANGIALFGLLGGAGALIAPLAGRLADKGGGRAVSLAGIIAVIGAFLLAAAAGQVWMLTVSAVAINAGVQANHVVSQRAVLSLRPEAASRMNSLYIAIFFLGGAVGSASSSPLLLAGWPILGLAGAALGTAALGIWPSITTHATFPLTSRPLKSWMKR